MKNLDELCDMLIDELLVEQMNLLNELKEIYDPLIYSFHRDQTGRHWGEVDPLGKMISFVNNYVVMESEVFMKHQNFW